MPLLTGRVMLVAVLTSLLSLSTVGVASAGGADAGREVEPGGAATPQGGDAAEICEGELLRPALHPALPTLCRLLDRFPPRVRLGIIAALEAHRHALVHARACRRLAEHPGASPQLAERCRESMEQSMQRGDRPGALAFCRQFVESARAAARPRLLERCEALLAAFDGRTPTRAELCASLARSASAHEHPRLERCAALERSGLEPSGPARELRPHRRVGNPRGPASIEVPGAGGAGRAQAGSLPSWR